MKFVICKASDAFYRTIINIKSLEELIKFIKQNDAIIVEQEKDSRVMERNKLYAEADGWQITIYDDYIE